MQAKSLRKLHVELGSLAPNTTKLVAASWVTWWPLASWTCNSFFTVIPFSLLLLAITPTSETTKIMDQWWHAHLSSDPTKLEKYKPNIWWESDFCFGVVWFSDGFDLWCLRFNQPEFLSMFQLARVLQVEKGREISQESYRCCQEKWMCFARCSLTDLRFFRIGSLSLSLTICMCVSVRMCV